jgi:DNA polymerase-3 subunit delta
MPRPPKAPSGLYLLLGPEEGEKDAFVRRLLGEIQRQRGEPPEVHRFYPFEDDLAEVLSLLANGSLFAGFRVAVVHNAEELKSKREVELLAEYAAHPPADTALLLLSAEVGRVDRRIERLADGPRKVIFWELFESQKLGWVNNFFRARGLQVQAEAVTFLLDMVENNTRELQAFCEKLALFFGSGSRIGLEDVEKVLYHSKEESAFSLFEKLSARDLAGSLEVLAKLLLSRDADAVQLLAVLAWQFRRLYAFQRLVAANYDAEEAGRRLEIRGKRTLQLHSQGARLYAAGELQRITRLTALFDLRARSLKSALHPTLLQLYLYYAVVRGGLPEASR